MNDVTIQVTGGCYTQPNSRFDASVSMMRIHEIAAQRWLNKRFFVQEGFPVPVIFTKPMTAFADFRQVLSQKGGPLEYLAPLKNEQGAPLYSPSPNAPLCPLITVNRKAWSYAKNRSFPTGYNRNVAWISEDKLLAKKDLGNVKAQKMPQGWDFTYQVDYYCNRPDSQAYFVNQLVRGLQISASEASTWIVAAYPGAYGNKLVRAIIDTGTINDVTEEEPQDGYRVYRTTFDVTIEGWWVDTDYMLLPALWNIVFKLATMSPGDVEAIYTNTPAVTISKNDKAPVENVIFNTAVGMPPDTIV